MLTSIHLARSLGSYGCAKSPLFVEDAGKKAIQQKAHRYICDSIVLCYKEKS